MELRRRLGEALVVTVAALVLVGLFNATQFTIDAFQFEVTIAPANRGVTEIFIPPLGSISAATHQMPLRLRFTLESINMDLLSSILKDGKEQQELLALFQSRGREMMKGFAVKLLLLAFLGGSTGALFLGFTKPAAYLRAGLTGLGVVALLLVGTYNTYQIDRFNAPRFDGALEAAPWVLSLAEEALDKLEDLESQIQVISSNYYYLFEQMEALEAMGSVAGEVKILHVSDIHNNPVALELISRAVDNFAVDYVIDTGDLSDYGTALEGLLTGGLAELPVPYVFVPGNHDSPASLAALQAYPNVIVLDEEMVELNGIRIFGLADPASGGNFLITETDEKYPGHTAEMRKLLETLEADIIAVHRPSQAKSLAGLSSLILHGHDHSYQIQQHKGSILVDAGTTGGAGIRGLQLIHEIPYTMVLLHLNRQESRWVLAAADTISFYGRSGKLAVERTFFAD